MVSSIVVGIVLTIGAGRGESDPLVILVREMRMGIRLYLGHAHQPLCLRPSKSYSTSYADFGDEELLLRHFRTIRWVLLYTMGLNLAVTAFKLIVGYLTGSLSLVADGYDSLFDSMSNVVGLVGIYVAARPPDADHPYGHRKYETLSAIVVVVLLFVTAVELVQSAFSRLRDPVAPTVNRWTFVALIFSVVVHLYVAIYEYKQGKALKSEFLIADALHTRADVLVSLSVIGGMIVVRLGYPIVDTILALMIAGVIAKAGIDIIRSSSKVLADAAALDEDQVQRVIKDVPGVVTFHRIRSRGQEDDIHLDLHVRVRPGTPVEQAHHIAHQVQRRLLAAIEGLRDVVVHVEPGEEAEDQEDIIQRVRRIADRIPGVAIHGIRVYDVEGKLSLTFHLEVDQSLSLEEAHALASQLEDVLRTEIANVADVGIHIEPADLRNGQAVTSDEATQQRIESALTRAMQTVDGLSKCHDVAVSRVGGRLLVTAHCECDPSLSVDHAHILSRQLEDLVYKHLPEVGRVVLHLEPSADPAFRTRSPRGKEQEGPSDGQL